MGARGSLGVLGLPENVPADFNRAKLVTLVKIRSPTHFRHFVAKGRPIVLPLVVTYVYVYYVCTR